MRGSGLHFLRLHDGLPLIDLLKEITEKLEKEALSAN